MYIYIYIHSIYPLVSTCSFFVSSRPYLSQEEPPQERPGTAAQQPPSRSAAHRSSGGLAGGEGESAGWDWEL